MRGPDGWDSAPVTIKRPRLLRRLQEEPRVPVTLVTAPAGSGKTALLNQWMHDNLDDGTTIVTWVTCDDVDDSPADLWTAIGEALAQETAAVSRARSAGSTGPRSQPKNVIRLLQGAKRPVVLILDDFHRVLDRESLANISFLAHHLPRSARLVLSSRFEPGVRLTKLRLDGQVRELRLADLAFTTDEVEELVAARGIALGREESDLLHRRTEGWVAGVKLSLMTMGAPRPPGVVHDLSSTESSIAAYLMEQVLAEMDPDSRTFLLDTSVVDQVTPEIAEHLTGRRDSAAMLHRLAERTGFLFPTAAPDDGYRYHALFVGLLRNELRLSDRSRHELLQRRVAEMLIRADRPAEALPHAVAAQSWDTAAAALFNAMARDLGAGHHADLAPWLAQFPASRLRSDPRVTLVAACLALLSDDVERARSLLDQAASALDALGPAQRGQSESVHTILLALCHRFENDHESVVLVLSAAGPPHPAIAGDEAVDASVRSCWHSVRAAGLLRLGCVDDATTTAERALTAAATRKTWGAVDALETLAMASVLRGDLRSASRQADDAWDLLEAGEARYVDRHIALHVCRVWTALDKGRFDDAARALADARDDRLGDFTLRDHLAIQAAQARLALHVDGDARDALARVATLAAQVSHHWLSGHLVALLTVECLVSVGQLDQAASVAHQHETAFPPPDGVIGLSAWVRARRLLAQVMAHGVRGVEHDPRATEDWARHTALMPAALEAPLTLHGSLGIRFLLTGALIEQHAGHEHDASHILNIVLDEVERQGWRLPFYELGDSVCSLLKAERDRIGEHGELLTRLLHELHTHEVARSSGLVDPLSKRESEVLQYLPTPLDRDELCAVLFISKNTLKSHLRSIYRKLGVDSRRDAVQKARALELL